MFVATYYDTDGYTYGCTSVIGVYETRPEADERCLRYHEDCVSTDMGNFEVQELSFGDWDL